MSTKSYQQDGFDKMTSLWHRRVRPGDIDIEGELLCWGNNRNGCCGQNVEELFVPAPAPVKCLYEAPKNLAVKKSCRQSSCYGDMDAFIAVEGSKEGLSKF